MKRGVRLEHLEDKPEHMRWLWAAHQRGALQELGLPDEQEHFGGMLIDGLEAAGVAGATLVFAQDKAVGIWLWLGHGHRIEPHVEWFPWATPREILEGTLKFLGEARKNHIALLFTKSEDAEFWHHIKRYGLIRFAHEIPNYFENGASTNLFYTREQWGL